MSPSRPLACTLLAVALLGAGCTAWLPRSRSDTQTRWHSYDEARATIDAIVPYQTTRADLAARGIDPGDSAVTLLSHMDIASRFPMGGLVSTDEIDPGIRDCIRSGKRCNGYLLTIRHLQRERVGNYWLDAFNFKRETEVSGWTFNALVILVDDVAVYSVWGGQPRLRETELNRNPLGPLQSWGERVTPSPPSPW